MLRTRRWTRCSRRRDIPQKRYREALQTHADSARQSRELLRIRTDVPILFDASAFTFAGANRERCYELFSRLGFRSLLMEYAPTAATIRKQYDLVLDEAGLTRLAGAIRDAGPIGLHILSDGTNTMSAPILGIAVATAPRMAWYIPWARLAAVCWIRRIPDCRSRPSWRRWAQS